MKLAILIFLFILVILRIIEKALPFEIDTNYLDSVIFFTILGLLLF